VVVFPVVSAVIAALCAVVVGRDAQRRPRPDKIAWLIAFVMFALAAGADAAGRELGWTEWLARLYYATGPALVVAFLAIGELYLLFPHRMGRFAPGAAVLLTAVWGTLVLGAPIDQSRLAEEGWEAIDRSGALKAMSLTINIVGTLIIVGGLLWSIWRFSRTGAFRNRTIGCSLIVAGTIAVAMGGTLTRLGHYEYLYIAMSIGIALIFGGVLWTRRPDRPAAIAEEPGAVVATGAPARPAAAPVSEPQLVEELAFLVEKVLPGTPDEVRGTCAAWSVQTDDDPAMSRRDARQAWRLRKHLPAAAQDRFDALPVPERRAVIELAAEVLQIPALTRVDDAPRPTRETMRLEG
jgi:hypothetical protein